MHVTIRIGSADAALGPLRRLRSGAGSRFSRFATVGATGLAVNTVVLAAFVDLVGAHYLLGAVLATQASTTWNFVLTERWVYGGREHRRRAGHRAAMFLAVNNGALLIRGPMLVLLTDELGAPYVVSNLITLIALVLVRFAVADTVIWARRRAGDIPGPAGVSPARSG